MTTYTWGTAVNADWSTSADWSGGGSPPPGTNSTDSALINATGANYTVTVGLESYILTNVTLASSVAALQVSGVLGTPGSLHATGALDVTNGTLSVLSYGTVQVDTSFAIANAAGTGAVIVNGTNGGNALLSLATGFNDGSVTGATGILQILNGGTVQLTGVNGITLGSAAGAVGSLTVSGTDSSSGHASMITWGTTASGMAVGGAGTGTVIVSNDGTIQMNGTNGLVTGTLSTGNGTITIATGGLINIGTNTTVGVKIGSVGTGSLDISGGSGLTIGAKGLTVGSSSTGTGTVSVEGSSSTIVAQNATGSLVVGGAGFGVLTINAGGAVSAASSANIGTGGTSSSNGSVTVGGGGSSTGTLTAAGLGIGEAQSGSGGAGVLTILGGGLVADSGFVAVGEGSLTTGSIVVNGGSFQGTSNAVIVVGTSNATGSGTGVLLIENSGSMTFANSLQIGGGGTGSATITSSGQVTDSGTFGMTVGSGTGGSGSLVVNGGTLLNGSSGSFSVGNSSATGSALVENAGGSMAFAAGITIGNAGTGTLTISGGAQVSNTGANGVVNVGTSTGGSGTLLINDGTLLAGGASVTIGGSSAAGNATVENSGSLSLSNALAIGNGGTGTLSVLSSANVTDTGTFTMNVGGGFSGGGSGALIVNGGTLTDTSGNFFVGNTTASGTVQVTSGLLTTGASPGPFADINATGANTASVLVNGGTWNSDGNLIIGDTGTGSLTISAGGLVNAGTSGVNIGQSTGGVGTATVGGSNSTFDTGNLDIGNSGTGYLTITAGGTVNAGSNTVQLGASASTSGTATVGGSGAVFDANSLNIATATSATGLLTINTGGSVTVTSMNIGALGTLSMGGGAITDGAALTPDSGLIAGFGTVGATLNNNGTINANGGTLDITGSISGTGVETIAAASVLEVDKGIVINTQTVSFANNVTNSALQLGSVTTTQNFGIANWQMGDELIISNGSSVTNAQWLSGSSNIGTLAVTSGGIVYDFTGVTVAASGPTPQFSFSSDAVTLVSCFTPGTLIDTASGPVPVEELSVGDQVLTADDNTCEPIIWIGHRSINCAGHPRPLTVWPVRIAAGAFGPGSPVRDLFLSPDHAVFVDGVLVPVKCLINGTTIAQQPRDAVTYYHIELPRHAVILAENLPVESYLDTGDRAQFSGGPVIALYPHFAARTWEMAGCAELVTTGARLDAVRASLAGTAEPRAAVAG